MPVAFEGHLTGSGTQALVGEVVPTDMDVTVETIGPHVTTQGPSGHRRLTNVGWIVFYNANFDPSSWLGDEDVSEYIWFNHESADQATPTFLGQPATHFAYWINPGSSVHIGITY
jgi:hypothetical protein